MFKNIFSLPLFRFAWKRLIFFTALLFIACFLFPGVGQMQNADEQIGDDLQEELQSPQATRPDILWMRGGHHLSIYKVIYTSDNQKVITLNPNAPNGDVKIWRLSDGVLLRTIAFDTENAAIDLSSDNQTLAILNYKQSAGGWHILFYNINTGNLIRTVNNLTALNGEFGEPKVDFSPDGNTLLAGKDFIRVSDGVILRSLPSGGVSGQYPNGIQLIGNGKSFSPSGNTILVNARSYNSSTTYPTLELDAVSFSLVRDFGWNQPAGCNSTYQAFSGNGAYVYGNDGGGIYIKNLSTNYCSTLSGGNYGGYNVTASPDGQFLARATITSGTSPATISVYNMTNPITPSLSYQFQTDAFGGAPPALGFSPDNSLIGTGGFLLKLWNALDGSFNRQISQFSGAVSSLAFSSDGQNVVTAAQKTGGSSDPNPGIKLWNVSDGTLQNVNFADSRDKSFYQLAFGANGQQIIALDNNSNTPSVSFWNASTGAFIRRTTFPFVGCGGAQLSVSPDGQLYSVYGCQNVANFYNVSNDSLFLQYNFSKPLAFTPNGQSIVAVKANNAVALFNVATGAEIRQFSPASFATKVGAVSPDGSTLIVGTRDGCGSYCFGSINFWNVANGTLIRSVNLNQTEVRSIAFAPNGQTFSTIHSDKTVRLWQTSDGALLQTFNEETGTVGIDIPGLIAYSPDGSKFAFGRGDATVVVARNPYPTTPATNYTISGQITRGGSALSNVSVTLSGNSTGSTTTDAGGNYSFIVAEGGSYTITPQLANNTFTPQSETFNFISENKTANFAANYVTYAISGNVKSDGGNLPGATVSLTGTQSQTTMTDAVGNYSFTANAGGNYTVTVSKNGIIFNPASQAISNLQANQTLTFTNGVSACSPQTSGLVSWYRAENNGLDSIGSNNGTAFGDLSYTGGKVGQAFNHDSNGGDYLKVTNPSNLPTGNAARTMMLWFKTPRANNQLGNNALVQYGTPQNNQMFGFITSNNASGKLYFFGYNNDLASQTSIQPDTWYHGAITYDGTNLRLYVNGSEEATKIAALNTILNADGLTIGYRSDFLSYWEGQTDEVKIYNRALSASEIQSVYNSANGCSSSSNTLNDLRLWYKGESNAVDSIGSNNGTLLNGATFATGKIGQAFSFDGTNDFVQKQNPGNLPIGNSARTMNLWFKTPRNLSTQTDSALVQYGNTADNQMFGLITSVNAPGKLYFWSYGFPQNDLPGTTTLQPNTWYHAAVTYDGAMVRLYLNGQLESQKQNLGINTMLTGLNGLTVGYRWAGPEHGEEFWQGEIDEVQIHGRALSSSEVQSIYQSGVSGSYSTGVVPTPTGNNVPAAPATNLSLNFSAVETAGNTSATPLSQSQLPALPMGFTLPANSPMYEIHTSASFSGSITVTFSVPGISDSATCGRWRVLHYVNGEWTSNDNSTPIYNAGICTIQQIVSSLSPFIGGQIIAPTAAAVSVRGRVTTADGNGIRNALVTLTDSSGNSQTVMTSKFGAYLFREVAAGQTYIISVSARRYTFSQSSQVRTVTEDLTDVDFIADEN